MPLEVATDEVGVVADPRLGDAVRREQQAGVLDAADGQHCPDDEELARIYGTSSLGRVRRMLENLEKCGAIVVRTDFHGRRVVAFPDLGVETAPGDPDAADELSAA